MNPRLWRSASVVVALLSVPFATWLILRAWSQYLNHSDVTVPGEMLLSAMSPAELPRYPADALAARQQGPVVVDIIVGPSGKVRRLKLLQAPSESIGVSVARDLQQRVFKVPVFANDQRILRSKVVLYFVITPTNEALVLRGSEFAKLRRSWPPGAFPASFSGK